MHCLPQRVCKRSQGPTDHSLLLEGATSCGHSQVETRFLPTGSHIPRDFSLSVCPMVFVSSNLLMSNLERIRAKVKCSQSKDPRVDTGKQGDPRGMFGADLQLLLYKTWRSEGHRTTQLPPKAINPCFICVECNLSLAFWGIISPVPRF